MTLMPTEQYKLSGRVVCSTAPDLREILYHAGTKYTPSVIRGLALHLYPTVGVIDGLPDWYVTFNPADEYHPDDWFHEASSNKGHLFNQSMHGPQAQRLFCAQLLIRRYP